MYPRILVPLDGSPTAQRGLREAIALARVHRSRLVLLHVLDDYPMLVESAFAAEAFEHLRISMRQQGERLLVDALAAATQAGVTAETRLREISVYRVAPAIVHECAEAGCDLIVMGTHGRRGFNRLLLGSDAETVLKTSRVPVLLVRDDEPATAS